METGWWRCRSRRSFPTTRTGRSSSTSRVPSAASTRAVVSVRTSPTGCGRPSRRGRRCSPARTYGSGLTPAPGRPSSTAATSATSPAIFADRVRLMLTDDDAGFANWDQDETAVEGRYAEQDPSTVAADYAGGAPLPPTSSTGSSPEQWQRPGRAVERLGVHRRDDRRLLPARPRAPPARRRRLTRCRARIVRRGRCPVDTVGGLRQSLRVALSLLVVVERAG